MCQNLGLCISTHQLENFSYSRKLDPGHITLTIIFLIVSVSEVSYRITCVTLPPLRPCDHSPNLKEGTWSRKKDLPEFQYVEYLRQKNISLYDNILLKFEKAGKLRWWKERVILEEFVLDMMIFWCCQNLLVYSVSSILLVLSNVEGRWCKQHNIHLFPQGVPQTFALQCLLLRPYNQYIAWKCLPPRQHYLPSFTVLPLCSADISMLCNIYFCVRILNSLLGNACFYVRIYLPHLYSASL